MFLAASRVCQYPTGNRRFQAPRPDDQSNRPAPQPDLSKRLDQLEQTIQADQEAQRLASEASWREMSRRSNRRIGLGVAVALGICAGSIAFRLIQEEDWY